MLLCIAFIQCLMFSFYVYLPGAEQVNTSNVLCSVSKMLFLLSESTESFLDATLMILCTFVCAHLLSCEKISHTRTHTQTPFLTPLMILCTSVCVRLLPCPKLTHTHTQTPFLTPFPVQNSLSHTHTYTDPILDAIDDLAHRSPQAWQLADSTSYLHAGALNNFPNSDTLKMQCVESYCHSHKN